MLDRKYFRLCGLGSKIEYIMHVDEIQNSIKIILNMPQSTDAAISMHWPVLQTHFTLKREKNQDNKNHGHTGF